MAVGAVGVGSGLDLESLINNLIAAERTPKLNSLAAKEATIQANISAFGGLRSVLDQFRNGLAGLLDAGALQARTATSSIPSYFSASADSTALAAQYDVQVLNLARAHKLVSTANFASSTATVGAGTLDISSGTTTFQVTTTATTTLAELEGLINSAPGNPGVTASLIVVAADPLDAGAGTLTRLVLGGAGTGAANTIGIAVNDGDGNHTDNQGLSRFHFSATDLPGSQLAQQQAAVDARIAVDGFTAFSSSNSFSGVIAGVTITAQREPADPLAPEVAQLTVAQDRAQLTSKVQAFVKSYNEVVNTISEVSRYDAATGTAGPLNGDSTVRGIAFRLRGIISSSVEGTSTFGTLAELGISTQSDGTLKLDTTRFNTALDSNFADVSQLFASENGVAKRLDDALESYIGRDGSLATRSEGFDRQIKSIADQRDQLELRLEKIEQQYRQRFTALDALVSQLQSSGDFLLAQLQTTANIIGGNTGGNN
ncbi:MAG: flagellar filament capping protein FliD [Gammaproteobacteria bacterium]|nr:flagellar filament capping protein FliD [Gammaproteobacteria bacterium]